MPTFTTTDDLIDVVVRLPRAAIVESINAARLAERRAESCHVAAAKTLLANRRNRHDCFGGIYFSDPAWDMMLELYVAGVENRTLRVLTLCSLSGASTSTAFRHMENLELCGYLRRVNDPKDKRSTLVVMQPALREAMSGWLDRFLVESEAHAR